jgi:hypothetical protein
MQFTVWEDAKDDEQKTKPSVIYFTGTFGQQGSRIKEPSLPNLANLTHGGKAKASTLQHSAHILVVLWLTVLKFALTKNRSYETMVHSSPLWEKNMPIGKLGGVPEDSYMYCFLLSVSPLSERRMDLKRTV